MQPPPGHGPPVIPYCSHCQHPINGPAASTPKGMMHYECAGQAFPTAPKTKQSPLVVGGIVAGAILVLGIIGRLARTQDGTTTSSHLSGTSASAPATSAASVPSTPVSPTAFPDRPVAFLDAKDILSEYKQNEVRGDAKYKGKIVAITGKVGEVKKDVLGAIYVTVDTGDPLELETIQCFAKQGQEKAIAALNRNDRVTVAGNVQGLMVHLVVVKDCELHPGVALCDKLAASLGVGGCANGVTGVPIIKLTGDTSGGLMCLPTSDLYDVMTKATDNRQKHKRTLLAPKALCQLVIYRADEKLLDETMILKVQKALDSL